MIYIPKIKDVIFFLPTIVISIIISWYIFIYNSKNYFFYNLDFKLIDVHMIEISFLSYLEKREENIVWSGLFKRFLEQDNLRDISKNFIKEISREKLIKYKKNNELSQDAYLYVSNTIDSVSTNDSQIDKLILISKSNNIEAVKDIFSEIIFDKNKYLTELIVERISFIVNKNNSISGVLKGLQDEQIRKDTVDLSKIDFSRIDIPPDYLLIDDKKLKIKIEELQTDIANYTTEVIEQMNALISVNLKSFDYKSLATGKYPPNQLFKFLFFSFILLTLNYILIFSIQFYRKKL